MKKTKKYSQTREELLLKLIHRDSPQAYKPSVGCVYDKNLNGGCAIGCDILPKLAEDLDGDVDDIYHLLPKRLRKMGKKFLSGIQNIHDNHHNYINSNTGEKGEDGLIWNNTGKLKINDFIDRYNLKVPKLIYSKDTPGKQIT